MTDDMNRAELALLLSLGAAMVARAGRITTEARYPNATTEQISAIGRKIEDILTDIIIGMREPGPPPTLEEIAQITDEVAMGAVLAILGDPPQPPPGN